MNINTDSQLIEQYSKSADAVALSELVRRYTPRVFGLARRYVGNKEVAADITQEVFVKVWKNIHRLDQTKSFKSWIFTITKNTALDWLKQKSAVPFSRLEINSAGIDLVDRIIDDSPSIIYQLATAQAVSMISGVLSKIPQNYSKVVLLRLAEDFSFRQIALVLNRPLNTVKSQYRRGIALLRRATSQL